MDDMTQFSGLVDFGKSELCKKCAHTKVCVKDKNLFGDVFIAGNLMFFDNKKLYEKFEEREKNGFPCDDFLSIEELKVRDQKKGKWKQGCCSECGYNWGKDAPIASVPKFCPNCGKEMERESNASS